MTRARTRARGRRRGRPTPDSIQAPPPRESRFAEVATWEPIDLSQAMVVVGFPTFGLVGSIATAYLVDSLKLREVGAMLSTAFPPAAVVKEGVGSSPVRVFIGDVKCGPRGECEQLCIVESTIAPPPKATTRLAYALVEWAQAHRARQLVCLEGVKMEAGEADEARIFGVANDPNGRKMLDTLKVTPPADGLMMGLGGVALYAARALGQPALCLIAETRENFPDARGAAKLLEVLQPLVPLMGIDERPLLEQAEILEKVFRELRTKQSQATKELAEPADVMFG